MKLQAEPSAIGNEVPSIPFLDDSGHSRNMNELKGAPTILVPVYTRCHGSCPKMASALRNAILNAHEPVTDYHVVLFTFDPRDGERDLRAFREHEHLPIQWTLARASDQDTVKLMNSIGFHYTGTPEGEYLHPNLAAILDPKLKVADLIGGDSYGTTVIEQALEKARGRSSLRATLEPYVLCVALLILVLSAGYFFHTIGEAFKKAKRNPSV